MVRKKGFEASELGQNDVPSVTVESNEAPFLSHEYSKMWVSKDSSLRELVDFTQTAVAAIALNHVDTGALERDDELAGNVIARILQAPAGWDAEMIRAELRMQGLEPASAKQLVMFVKLHPMALAGGELAALGVSASLNGDAYIPIIYENTEGDFMLDISLERQATQLASTRYLGVHA